MTVVYVDTLFLLNLTIDYLLLRLSARICGQYVPTLRLALGALMGAVYALCAFLPQGHFLTYPPVKVAVLMVSLLGSGGLTYANGIPATGLDFKILCLSAAGSYLVLSVGMRCLGRYSKVSKEILPVTLTMEGRTVRLDALVDTGNTLADPLSDAKVLVAEWEAVRELFAADLLTEQALCDPVGGAAKLAAVLGAQRVRMIPYRSVGVSSGMLLAVRVDGAVIGSRVENRLLVALCPGKLSVNGNYTALVGADG